MRQFKVPHLTVLAAALLILTLNAPIGSAAAQATTVPTAAPTSAATARQPLISVQADQPIGMISPLVYGANDGPWSVLNPAMLPQAQAAHITYLRFPGGNWGDENDLTDFDIDFYIILARSLHAEPNISVRLKGGTPAAAAQLVQYVNIDSKYHVHYWSIGNEPDLYPNYTIAQYVQDWRAIAKAMLAVDPSIVLVGPDISQYPPPDGYNADHYRSWITGFLKADGDLVSIVSIHRYPFPAGTNAPPTTIDQLGATASEWDRSLPDLRAAIKESAGHDLPIGLTEINSHWDGSANGVATPDSFYNAIWWAASLGDLIRNRVDLVNYFTLNTTDNIGSFGLIAHDAVRPTYYVYLLAQKLGDRLLTAQSTDPAVTITAAMRSDGALTLWVVNTSQQSRTLPITVSAFTGAKTELWRLDPTHNATDLGTTNEIVRGQVTLPAESASLYIVTQAS